MTSTNANFATLLVIPNLSKHLHSHFLPCTTCGEFLPLPILNDHRLSCTTRTPTPAPTVQLPNTTTSASTFTRVPTNTNTVTTMVCSRDAGHSGPIYGQTVGIHYCGECIATLQEEASRNESTYGDSGDQIQGGVPMAMKAWRPHEELRFKQRLAVYPIDPRFKQNNWDAFARGLQIIGVHRNGKQCRDKYWQLVAKGEIEGVTSNMLTSHKRRLESSGESPKKRQKRQSKPVVSNH